MKKRIIVAGLIGLLILPVFPQRDMEVVRERVVSDILVSQVDDTRIKTLVHSLGENGSWPDINYTDVKRTGFEHVVHLQNMLDMSLAFNQETSGFYKDRRLNRALSSALAFWCENDFICDNWWNNQIGTPRSLVAILLIMEDHLDADLVQRTLEIIGRAHLDAGGARPGGDRIKIGGIEARKVLVEGDEQRFGQIMQVINDEIKFSTGQRGLQHDLSFHHRVDRVNNTTSYGLGYAAAFAEWAVYVAGTKYAFEEEKIRLLVDYYLDGICKQMVYGVYTDKGVKNRSVSRIESFGPHSTEIPEDLLLSTDYRKEELEEIIRLRKGEATPGRSFARFFWQSEHFAVQRPGYYTSVRMYSLRNRNMEEPYNSEGLYNHHKGDGANFISLTGEEYVNIWPVYDWQKIPGTTVLQKPELPDASEIRKEGLTTFVGAVTDGMYGAAGFDFLSPHDLIRARKGWFFFDEEFVCLGASIESRSRYSIATTLNQTLLRGEVLISDQEGTRKLEEKEYQSGEVRWIHHDGVGYLFPQPADIRLSARGQSGSWFDINRQWDSPREQLEKDVFKLWIDHGVRPQGRRGGLDHSSTIPQDVTYAYIVLPTQDPGTLDRNMDIEILANTRNLQAVKHSGLGICQLIFYRGGEVPVSDNLTVRVDSPGAVMIELEGERITKITVADPTRTLDRLHLEISGSITVEQRQGIKSFYDGDRQSTHLSIPLPDGHFAGQSITLLLQ